MTQHELHNALRILTSMDADEVPFLDGARWQAFRTDPFRFFIRCDQETCDALWRVIEARQPQSRTVTVAPGIRREMRP